VAHYLYQTVAPVTSDDDDTVIVSISAVGSLVGSEVSTRKPKVGKVAPVIAPEDRKPYRFTITDAPAIARFRVDDPSVIARWAALSDASERYALLVATGVEPTYGTSPLSPTVAQLAAIRALGRTTFEALQATGGFVILSERGSKAAATTSGKRSATASERNAAVLDSMFADADAAPDADADAKPDADAVSEPSVIDAALVALDAGDGGPVLDAVASGAIPTDAPVAEEAARKGRKS